MLQRLAKSIVVLVTLSILYSGPVAACLCADEPMPPMPCCPGEPQSGDHAVAAHTGFTLEASCETASAEVLPPGSQEMPAPTAIASAALPPCLTRGPPAAAVPLTPQPYDSPPIYLVTLRLRN